VPTSITNLSPACAITSLLDGVIFLFVNVVAWVTSSVASLVTARIVPLTVEPSLDTTLIPIVRYILFRSND